MARVGWRHIQLDPSRRTVFFARRGLEIDPGGIAKGYAVDRIAALLRNSGVASGLIYAGRSSIYAMGAPPSDARGWRVAIPNPRRPSQDAFEVFLRNESMSTSGSTERFFFAAGHRYSHLMDPRSGYPAQGMLAVSVVAPRGIDSEAWTKPFFVLGRNWTARNKPSNFRVFLCEDLPEQPCVSLP
jgi:thiamine biosynthesis lipoprotein